MSPFEEFLYMDPDTGEVVCMVADGDGFRPAHVLDLVEQGGNAQDLRPGREQPTLTDFVNRYDRAFISEPSAPGWDGSLACPGPA